MIIAAWPGGPPLSTVFLSFPISERGCPILACFARVGRDAADSIMLVMPRGLHRYYSADHLHFITCSCCRRPPLLRSARSRDRVTLRVRQTRQHYRFVVRVGRRFRFANTRRERRSPWCVQSATHPSQKAAKDGAPTVWSAIGRLGHPPTPPGPPGIPLEVWLSIQCAPALVKISTESLSPDSLAILNAVLFQRSFSSGFAPASSSMRIYAGR